MTFSLDSRSDRRGEHPIRLNVRSCDGHRFQSTVGYNVPSEKWDSDKQRAIVDMESDSAVNCKGIPFSEINERIEAISRAFEALLSVPGAATKSALASALDQVTSKSLDSTIPNQKVANDIGDYIDWENEESGQIASGNESSNAEDLAIVREFLSNFHDFASKDRRKGYVNVYRPDWHERNVHFFIHLPKKRKGKRSYVYSGAIMMKGDGSILVQGLDDDKWEMSSGKTFELSKCVNSDIKNLVASIKEYQSYMPENTAIAELIPSIVIPTGKQRVGNWAFRGYTELKAVSIPNGITEIGEYAFCDCSGLTEIHFPDSVSIIDYHAFDGCSRLRTAYLSNVVIIKGSAFKGCTGLKSVYIPDSVTEIGDSAFEGCTGLTEIHIPDGITKIGYNAFEGCSGLKNL